MRIVHFSTTKSAGGPYRLVSLLRKHSNFEVNLVDLKRRDRYPHDIVYEEEKEKAHQLAANADIIHFHNYYDQYSRFFKGLNFKELKKKGIKFICQLRGEPHTIALNSKTTVSEIQSYDIPTIAIAQYPERFYPRARVVPNAVPSEENMYLPGEEQIEYDILFSPTKKAGAWEERWNTKGSIETMQMMKKLESKEHYRVKSIYDKPLKEILQEKQKSRIVLDDMITGSYHVSGLEALCQAKTVLCYIDTRICNVLNEITGTAWIPFVNVRLEDAYHVLKHLGKDHNLTKEIGNEGRKWIDNYWSEKIIVEHYVDVYKKLLDDPSLIKRQKALRVDRNSERFFTLTLPDCIYTSRSEKFCSSLPVIERAVYLKKILCKNINKKRKMYTESFKIKLYNFIPKPALSLLKKLR